MKDNRMFEIDFIRVISMLGVILIHATSTFIFAESSCLFFGMNLSYILNQFARFSVPMFILLSGLVLKFAKTNANYFKSIKKLLIPYLIWCLIYFAFNNDYNLKAMLENKHAFIYGIFTGTIKSHLYFMVVIIQLYFLYPLFIKLKNKYYVPFFIFSLTITLYFQFSIYYSVFGLNILPSYLQGYVYLLFPTYLFYFVLGMYINKDLLLKIKKIASKNMLCIFVLYIIFNFLMLLESKLTKTFELSIKPQSIILIIITFVFFSGLSFYVSKITIFEKIIFKLSSLSFTIYFCHVFILIKLRRFFSNGTQEMLLLFVSTFIFSFVFSFVFDIIAKKIVRFKK